MQFVLQCQTYQLTQHFALSMREFPYHLCEYIHTVQYEYMLIHTHSFNAFLSLFLFAFSFFFHSLLALILAVSIKTLNRIILYV